MGMALGYHTKGPSEVLGANLTGHAHAHAPLFQIVGLLDVVVAGDPLLYECMKEGSSVFYQRQNER